MIKKNSPPEEVKITRLPCRGCTRNCKNYGRCNGKPWRLAPTSHNQK